MTDEAIPVDASVMWPIARIADRDGVSKQAVSKQVKRLIERHALQHDQDGQGRVVAVNVVHYDKLRGVIGDSAKRREAPARSAIDANSLDAARLTRAHLDAELARINLAERRGELIRRDLVVDALNRVVEDFRRIATVVNDADDIAAAMARGGFRDLRAMLKIIDERMQTALADRAAAFAAEAQATDPPLPQETPQPV